MVESEHDDPLRRWLVDDPKFVLNTVFLVAAGSLALAVTSCLWHHVYHSTPPVFATAFPSRTLPPTAEQPSPGLTAEQHDRKSTRSKERRRRNKDPFRDALKGGKKSKVLLKDIKTVDHDDPAPPDVPHDSASSTSRSASPAPDRPAPESDEGSGKVSDTSSTSALASSGDVSDHACHADGMGPHVCATANTHVDTVSTGIDHVPDTSSPLPAACAEVRTDGAAFWSESLAKLGRTRSRGTKIDCGCESVPSDSVLPIAVSTSQSTEGAGPSTPTNSRGSTPPPPSEAAQPVEDPELASMRGALEAARLREEQLRVEAEQASKERDELCWRWNEDAGVWRRREAELQGQIHHLVQQVQAYAAAASFVSSPTSPHGRSPRLGQHPLGFPAPAGIETQNSASAPAHVHALLRSHPPGFAAPVAGGLYSGAGFGMSPLMWSGLCAPTRDARHGGRATPDSSASGSSPRGRGRRRRGEVKSASDESSLGDWDGSEEDEEEEEDILRNNALADAILKRPESIRNLSGSLRKRGKDALKDGAVARS